MSDHWELFPCQIGDHAAIIVYDHGISDEIDQLALSTLLKVRILLREPNDDGLPINEEADVLNDIEEELIAAIEPLGGVCVGRLTTDGRRLIYSYLDASEDEVRPIVERLGKDSGHQVTYLLEDDAEKKGYWEELFPTKYDWRVLQDMKVVDQLLDHGDTLEKERRVDHWAYFNDPKQRQAFEAWAKGEGFTVERLSEPGEEQTQHGIQIHHRCAPTLEQITHYTCLLTDKAEEFGGDYDGWETSLERSEP